MNTDTKYCRASGFFLLASFKRIWMAREHREAKARSPSPHISRRRRPDLGSAHPLAAGAAETASVLLVKAPSVPVKKQEALSTISSSMTNEAHPNPIGEQPAPFVGPFIIDPRSSRSPVSSNPCGAPSPGPVQGRSWVSIGHRLLTNQRPAFRGDGHTNWWCAQDVMSWKFTLSYSTFF